MKWEQQEPCTVLRVLAAAQVSRDVGFSSGKEFKIFLLNISFHGNFKICIQWFLSNFLYIKCFYLLKKIDFLYRHTNNIYFNAYTKKCLCKLMLNFSLFSDWIFINGASAYRSRGDSS